MKKLGFDMQNQYVPGACNIGKNEIAKRQTAGWIGLILTVGLFGLFAYLEAPRSWRLLIFIPAMMAAIGFLQARMHFCAYFGMRGVFNFAEVGKTDTVEQAEFRAKDRRKAWQIIIYSVIAAVLITILAYYLP
jgi:hypothetical protein